MVKKVGFENPYKEDIIEKWWCSVLSFILFLSPCKVKMLFFFSFGLNNGNFEFHGVCLICFLKSINLSLSLSLSLWFFLLLGVVHSSKQKAVYLLTEAEPSDLVEKPLEFEIYVINTFL
jgi:hypothetical protein